MNRLVLSWLVLSFFIVVTPAHEPERSLYEDLPSKVYPASGPVYLDDKTGYCYRQFFVPMPQGHYEKHYLPLHCDHRLLSVGHPELRVKKWILKPMPPSGLPMHHRIKRNLPDGSLEFSKNIAKAGVQLGKKAREVLLRIYGEAKKRVSHSHEIYSSLVEREGLTPPGEASEHSKSVPVPGSK